MRKKITYTGFVKKIFTCAFQVLGKGLEVYCCSCDVHCFVLPAKLVQEQLAIIKIKTVVQWMYNTSHAKTQNVFKNVHKTER